MRNDWDVCTVCDDLTDPSKFPFCSSCGVLLFEVDDLDLSPNASITTIFKKVKVHYLQ